MRLLLRCIAMFILALASASGCGRPDGPPTTASPAIARAQLRDRIAAAGSVTFRSWDGKWIGLDSDTEITFLPDQAIHMTEYGDGVSHFKGRSRIDPSGQITLLWEDFGHEWPVMILERDATSLRLRPSDSDQGFVMGDRSGATLQSGQGSYWPFRPVTAKEEAQIREEIGK